MRRRQPIKTYDIFPERFFGHLAEPDSLTGADASVNAGIITDIFDGEKSARRNVVVINAAAAIVTAGKAKDMNEGVKAAQESIDTGMAAKKLKELVEFVR